VSRLARAPSPLEGEGRDEQSESGVRGAKSSHASNYESAQISAAHFRWVAPKAPLSGSRQRHPTPSARPPHEASRKSRKPLPPGATDLAVEISANATGPPAPLPPFTFRLWMSAPTAPHVPPRGTAPSPQHRVPPPCAASATHPRRHPRPKRKQPTQLSGIFTSQNPHRPALVFPARPIKGPRPGSWKFRTADPQKLPPLAHPVNTIIINIFTPCPIHGHTPYPSHVQPPQRRRRETY